MTDTANMRTRIADELNRLPSEIIGSPSLSVGLVINREINSAIKHYESMRTSWSEVKDAVFGETTSGQRSYSLSTSDIRWLKIDSIKLEYNNSYITLDPITWSEMEEKDRQITGSLGLPQNYVIYSKQVRMYPVPNASLTILISYLERPLLTSLTGCLTGTGSQTPTSTASHNNRLGGWYDDGAALIRARAKAAVQIKYLRDGNATAEAALIAQTGGSFLSMIEKQAYEQLTDEIQDQLSTGRLKPYFV